jgi:acyl-CoA reductase-like NAD-dependent aldehyde dehydrogenase
LNIYNSNPQEIHHYFIFNILDEALNVITGFGKTAGEPLSRHKDVNKVTFTGSVPVGRSIMANAATGPIIKGVILELGESMLII